MKRYSTLLASFVIMLAIGSIYAWSIIASELIEEFGFSGSQTQTIFGTLVAIFPVTMILVGKLSRKMRHQYFGYIAGLLFLSGYMLAGYSRGNFYAILTGIGLLGGIATGFGYWVALTTPVQWFPERKGLVTGIAAAGFGLGAVFMSEIAEVLLNKGYSVLRLLNVIGISYGIIIFAVTGLIRQKPNPPGNEPERTRLSSFIGTPVFRKLFAGIFLGTFAGLLIIGSLRMIGAQYECTEHALILGVALFALANFVGRIFWGFCSDRIGGNLSIFLALLFQSAAIMALNLFTHSDLSYVLVALFIGFGFGGNFVLFAKETAQEFGIPKLGIIYPYVFMGYAIAGIAGPISGGLLFDRTGSFTSAIVLASAMSLAGSLLFLFQFMTRATHEPSR
jgi:MFS transporter, OFA family, oxalate/formate antiporter